MKVDGLAHGSDEVVLTIISASDIVSVREFTEVLPNNKVLFFADAQLAISSRITICSGAGWSAAEARSKMVSELAERYIALTASTRQDVALVGYAAHISRDAARTNATQELLERSFLGFLAHRPSRQPDLTSDWSWAYALPEYSSWFAIARVSLPECIAWGSAVRSRASAAVEDARIEATMMAYSHKHYARPGRAIFVLHEFEDWPKHLAPTVIDESTVLVVGETRHVSMATWRTD